MNIRDFEYFNSLAQLKSYTLVAEHYKVSQPTISMSIKRLESDFNANLFIRDKSHKQLIITPAGIQLQKHVENILNEVQIAHQEIYNTAHEKIVIGLPPIIGNYYFPKLASSLAQDDLIQYLKTVETGSDRLLTLLNNGKLDLALLGSLEPLDNENLTSELIAKRTFKIIVGRAHPLSQQKNVTFSDLADEKFIMLKEGFVHPKAFEQLNAQAGIHPKIIYQTNDIAILKSMVKENVGIGFLSELAIQPTDDFVALDIEAKNVPPFMISLVTRQSHVTTPFQEKIIDMIKKLS